MLHSKLTRVLGTFFLLITMLMLNVQPVFAEEGPGQSQVQPQYYLTTSVSPSGIGSISISPSQPAGGYYEGTQVTLTANPTSGYEFDHWEYQKVTSSGAAQEGTTTDNPISITMYGPAQVTACFSLVQQNPRYDLTVSIDPFSGGSVSNSPAYPAGGYYEGTQVTLTAEPAQGYEFDHWEYQKVTSSGAAQEGTTTGNPLTITMYGPAQANAFFVEHSEPLPPIETTTRYTLSTNVNPSGTGNISKDPIQPRGGYYEGTEVTLTATPNEGYVFDHWIYEKTTSSGMSQAGTTSDNPLTITMYGPASAFAYFTAVPQYNLPVTISPTGGGTVTKDPTKPTGGYYEGTEVTLTATPNEGYVFDHWIYEKTTSSGMSQAGTTSDNPLTITMYGPASATVFFTFIDNVSPTADIVDILPDPRSSPVGLVEIVFSEPVSGVDINDLSLTLNGDAVSLAGLSVNQIADDQYTIDLTSVTPAGGTYTLTLVAAGSGVIDNAGNPLASDAADSWVITKPVVLHDIYDGDWQWSVVYSDPITINLQMTDTEVDNLKNQMTEPKLVYLEYWNGIDWFGISECTLVDKTLTYTFQVEENENIDVCAGDYPIRFRFDGDSLYEPIIQPGILSILIETPFITDKDHEPDTWHWDVSHTDTLTINLILTDNDAENMYHQGDQAKTVYLERLDGTNWIELDSDILEDINGNDSNLQFEPNLSLPGDYSIRFRFDGDCRYSGFNQEGSISVLNQPPVAYDQSVATREDRSIAITLTATDPDGDPIPHWWPWINPQHGTIHYASIGPNWTYTPNPGYTGIDSFVFKVADTYSAQGMATVYIDVIPNQAPIAHDQSVITNEDTAISITLQATDPEGDPIPHWWPWINPTHGTIYYSSVGPNWTYTPHGDYYGPDSFVFKVADTYEDQGMATVTIMVNPINDAPSFVPGGDLTVDEDSGPYSELWATQIKSGPLNESSQQLEFIVTNSNSPLFSAPPAISSNGELTFTPAPDAYGSAEVTVQLHDNGGTENGGNDTSQTESFIITVLSINDPPVANANGPYSGYEGSEVALDGSASYDPDGMIASYDWVFGDTGAGSGSAPEHTYLENGTYNVILTVTDDEGATDTATTTVTVLNVAPTVEAGENINIAEGTKFRFMGSFADPGLLDTHEIEWDFGNGGTASNNLTPEHSYGDNGVYTVTLTVTDDEGGIGTDTLTVTVSNVSPVVNAGDDITINEGGTAHFNGVFKDSGWLDTHTFEWDFDDGSPLVQGTLTPTHMYTDDGVYTVTLTVTDDDGGTGKDTLTVTVLDLAPKADFEWNPEPQDESSAIQFTNTSKSYPDDITIWAWDFAGLGSSNEQNPSFTFPDNGTYPVTLTVTDDDGSTDTISHLVTVQNVPPVVDAGPDQVEYWGLEVDLIGSFGDPGIEDTHTFEWAIGDGDTAATLEASHTYADAGTYTAVLTVTDDDGGAGSDIAEITVVKRPTSLEYTGDTGGIFGFTSTLSAQLSDSIDEATARLAGLTVTFTIDGETYETAPDANGIASVVLSTPLLPGTYDITVGFTEDTHYLGSSDEATLTITSTVGGKVTAGTIRTANNGRGGFNVQSNTSGIKGELQFQNKSINFHAHEMTALGISPNGTKAWFAGVGTDGETFVAYVEDNGEPGKNDIFKIWIDGVLQNGDGGLTGGNVQIH